MKCKLPFKGSLQNSKAFLQDMDIIGEDYKILNDMEFDKVTFELEKENIQTYKVSGRPWIRDIVRGGMYAEPNLEVLERIDQKRKDLGLYEDQLSAEVPLPLKDNRPISTTQYQNVSDQSIGITASEKTIRDLAARMSDRIGIPVKFISDRSQGFKGKIEDNVAVINLSYATLDTVPHEILGHPIIRAIKYGGKSPTENPNKLTGEFLDNFKKAKIGGEFVKTDLGYKGIKISDTHYANLIKTFDGSIDKRGEFRAEEELLDYAPLYQNLLKELEYGRGKEVLDRIKRDYTNKTNEYNYSKGEKISDEEYYNIKVSEEKTGSDEYLGRDFYEKRIGDKVYTIQKGEDANPNSARVYTLPTYSLEEQQEEAIVELLGLMTAEKLDAVKDGKLISLLKRLLKEIKAFVKDLFKQREVEIDKLPDDMTLGDLSDLLAYSNSKLILPGYEVQYTTPDNQTFKTYQEASNHISKLAKNVKDVDLDNIKINPNLEKEIKEKRALLEEQLRQVEDEIREANNELDKLVFVGEKMKSKFEFTDEYKDYLNKYKEFTDKNLTPLRNKEKEIFEQINEIRLEEGMFGPSGNTILNFIQKNKEYEQSKEIIEEWKKVNNIQYNPEEIYSRGQEFSSVVGAYSSFDVNLMMQNLLSHIEDNEKAGGKFAISAYTKPIDKQIGHLEGGGGKIKFKLYPQSNDILWAANVDVYSGSVWDASEKVNKDKKSELLGVSYTKYPSLSNVNAVQPNLASIVEDLSHHHNELGIVLTGSNFRLEYDDNIPYQTKKIIDSINSILDQKYGKLVKPEINKPVFQKVFEVFYRSEVLESDGAFSHYEDITLKKFNNEKDAQDFIDNESKYYRLEIKSYDQQKMSDGIQPTQTNETLKESIDSVKSRTGYKITVEPISKETYEKAIEDSYSQSNGMIGEWTEDGLVYFVDLNDTVRLRRDKSGYFKESVINSEYTSQALINTKIAALKEVAKKYPRSLIRSEVKQRISSTLFTSEDYDLPFQKIPSANQINEPDTTILKDQGFFDIDRNIKLTFDFTNKSYIPREKVESLEEMANRIGVLQRKEREYLLTKQKLNDSGVSKPVSSRITIGEFTKPAKDFKGIQPSHIGKYVWNGTNYRFEPIKGSENTPGSKFVSQVFGALLDKNRSQQLLDRGLENAWLQRKESPESFMAALSLSIGSRMSAKYKRLGFVSYRVSEHPGAGMFFYNPNDKTIDINLHHSFAWLTNYERLEDLVNNLESVLDEEIIHSIADKILTKEDVSNIYNELTAFEKQKIKQYYLGRNDDKGDLSEHQLVHEYLRVVTQQELFNQTTEDTYRIRLVQSAIDFFKRLLNEIVNLFRNRIDNPLAKRAVENIRSILSSEEFYQIQSRTDEITPALKNTLEQFVRKLNPDFKIEVLDDLLDRRGVNGIAKISEFVIQLQKGKETALPEEVSHFLVELLDNDSPLKKTMKDEITRTRLYKNLRQHPGYKKVFGNDLDGFKREAMAKLVALYLTDKESFKYQVGSDSVYENIVRWIKDFFRWIKGQSNAIGSFIEAADKIVNLDTSGLLLQQGRYVEEMYSMGDFITSATTLTTVSNLNTKYYDRVLINLSDTVFDTNGFFGADKARKRKVLFAGDDPELIDFYNNVELTSLGRELQDKMSNGAIENITFYTSMSHHPALEQRLQSLFGLNVDIKYLNKTGYLEDEFGNVIMETESNTLPEFVRGYGNMKTVLVDNQPINVGFNVESRLYRESKSTIYESFIETLRNRDKKEAEQNRMKSFLDELSTLSQDSVTLKIKEGFSIIRSNFGEIGRLEETLSKEEIDDAYDSLFREEGALLLPIAQAKKGKKLLEKIDQYENAVLTFFGTLEAVTNFFKDRNEADYEQIKKRLDKGSEKEIDMAIKELALVNKMGQKWEGFIKDMTALIAGVPKTEAVSKVLGNLSQQIATSRIKSRNLAVHVIGAKLTPLLASYNADRLNELNTMLSRLDKVSEAEKPAIQKTINRLKKDQNEDGSFLNADDIIDILNGEGKDMAPLTVWLKPLHNSSDLIVGPLVKLLRKSQAEVEVAEIVRAQQAGSFIRGEEKESWYYREGLE
jgi:hypothetical protein